MNHTFSKKLRFFLLFIALPLIVAKLLWSVSEIFLQKAPPMRAKHSTQYNYHYSLYLANKIIGNKVEIPQEKPTEDDGQKLEDIKLKGTYLGGDASFIIIEDGGESKFIYIGEKFRGYELNRVGERKVVFEKNGKNYYVLLDGEEEKRQRQHQSSFSGGGASSQEDEDTPVSLTHEEMKSYLRNPDKIWNNIRIQEMRREGELVGFRVNYVKRGSFFDKAGLRSGDVIKAIDGNEIHSLGDVMKYYNNADNLESLSLTVLRNGQEKELDFSVN